MTDSNIALEFNNVVKKFGRCAALDGFTMKVQKGTILGLVGSNGAGKTTSISVAAGLLNLNRGSVDILGDGAFDPLRHAGRVSMMPQDAELPLYAKVRDLLAFYARLQGVPVGQVKEEVERVIKWVNLADRAGASVRSLSHGMRRRIVVAQAFLGNPELVLLDEPMSGLDPREVINIRKLLVQRTSGQTIVISSHNLHELELVCDHVAFIEQGKLVRHDSMDAITGRQQIMNFEVSSIDGLSLDGLREQLADVVIDVVESDNVLACSFSKSEHSAEELNRIVLRYLLDNNIDIIEVRRGKNLESAYITHSKN
ncbi:hypothetical protein BVX94_00660 [bacterium B17]|nr:hypothetical protein BVX94_00660 [bacterium B17]